MDKDGFESRSRHKHKTLQAIGSAPWTVTTILNKFVRLKFYGTMKLENNWRQKTLENLEKEKWRTFDSDSRLIKRIKELRRVPLDNFTVEDLRLMIGQHESLDYLIPLAIEKLQADILAEGDLYKGDLLLAVVNARQDYWDKSTEQKGELIELITRNKELIESEGLEIEID